MSKTKIEKSNTSPLSSTGKTDKKLMTGMLITLGASMLTPEYIAPFFVFALYIFFMKVFKKSGRNAKMGDVGKVFFAYTIFMLVSSLWSGEKLMSALVSLMWMGCLLGYILVANVVNTQDKLKNAITAVNLSAGIVGAMAILAIVTYNLFMHCEWFKREWLFPNPFYWELNDKVFSLLPIEIINYKFRARASATFDNPLILATYLVTVTPFCAFGSVYFKTGNHRKISRVCLLLSLGGLVCTSSRGSYIAIAAAILIMIFSSKKSLKKLFPFVIALIITVPVALMFRYKNTKITDFIESDSQRINIWKSCVDMFLKNPILGLGAGTENIHQSLINDYNIERTHAHNLFLEMLVEGGIAGGIFVVAICMLIVRNIVRISRLKNGKYKKYATLYAACFVGFLIMSVFEFTLQSAKELMTFFFLLGFTEATYRIASDKVQLAPDELPTQDSESNLTESEKKPQNV